MEVDEEHVQTLLSMGFPSELDVRKALRLSKNSLNDAVAILTNDHPSTTFDTLDDIDVDMEVKDFAKSSTAPVYGPNLPPTYEDVVDAQVVENSILTIIIFHLGNSMLHSYMIWLGKVYCPLKILLDKYTCGVRSGDITSNFSVFHNVFYPTWYLFFFLNAL